jgi:hypothetical protein
LIEYLLQIINHGRLTKGTPLAKPIAEHEFLRYLRAIGWHLKKGGIDYNLYDHRMSFLCSIKINHSKGSKREVSPTSVRKIEKLCKERGLKWPPGKK